MADSKSDDDNSAFDSQEIYTVGKGINDIAYVDKYMKYVNNNHEQQNNNVFHQGTKKTESDISQ